MPSKGKQNLHPAQFSIPRGRALLLDDDEKDVKYFTSLLEGLAYSVRAFTNYQEAEECLEHEPFEFIVVSPAFEAHRLMELTLARRRHTPRVLLTRCLEMNCCVAAMQLGADMKNPSRRRSSKTWSRRIASQGRVKFLARASERLSARCGASPAPPIRQPPPRA